MIYEVRITSGGERITVLLQASDEAEARAKGPLIAFKRPARFDEVIGVLPALIDVERLSVDAGSLLS